jgi:RNA polymerase sigma factor (sigma-70 family)
MCPYTCVWSKCQGPATTVVHHMAAVLNFSQRSEFLGALHARFAAPLQRFFRGYRLNLADAEDLTQDVFVRLAGPGAQTDLRKPDAFVFTLARNLVRDRARRLHTRAASMTVDMEDIKDLSCHRPTPEEALQLAQSLQHVEKVLAALKPNTRQAFEMHRVHGNSYAEIAAHMRISVSMVEKHLMAGIVALRASSAHAVSRTLSGPSDNPLR